MTGRPPRQALPPPQAGSVRLNLDSCASRLTWLAVKDYLSLSKTLALDFRRKTFDHTPAAASHAVTSPQGTILTMSTAFRSFVATPVSARPSARRAAVRSAAVVVAKERPMWLPGTSSPKHLDGTLAGDYGEFLARERWTPCHSLSSVLRRLSVSPPAD